MPRLGVLVESPAEIEHNIRTLERFRTGTVAERKFHHSLIKNGKLFVVLKTERGALFAPSRFAGYSNNDLGHLQLENRDGGTTNVRIAKLLGAHYDVGELDYLAIDNSFLDYCAANKIEPSRHARARRYWLFDPLVSLPKNRWESEAAANEVRPTGIWEGALEKVWVNKYERDPKARQDCLKHYGCSCVVCDMTFGTVYGSVVEGFIHVHHLVPLSTIKNEHEVDPVRDLRPVCPNCHSVLHTTGDTVDELRARINRPRK